MIGKYGSIIWSNKVAELGAERFTVIACGYAERKPLRGASGRIIQHEYLVYDHKVLAKEAPLADSPLPEKPEVANPDMGQPLVADRTLPINDKN